jgi:predicted Ser/Thr protein kinase
MPSKIAWENQMKLLEKVPEDKRVNQVKNAILKGWRSVAFVTPFNDKTTTSNVTRKHTDKSTVCSTGF